MRCLVTGSAGFIGRHLVRRLEEGGHQVVPFDKADLMNGLDLTVHTLEEFVEGVDVVFHLAAATGLHRGFCEYLKDNVLATQCLLEACRKVKLTGGLNLKKFVLASTSSVYGLYNGDGTEEAYTAPVSWYGCTKLAAEDLCRMYKREYGLPLTMLRLFSVYGPGQRPDMAIGRFMEAILLGDQVQVCGNGNQVRSYTYVDDIVDALALSPDLCFDTYNVSGSCSYNANEMVDMLRRVTDRNFDVVHVPDRLGEQRWAVGNCSSLNAAGWHAKVDFEEGLRRQWEWQKNL